MNATLADFSPQHASTTAAVSYADQQYSYSGESSSLNESFCFEFDQQLIPLDGNGLFLKLWQNPKLKLGQSYEIEVDQWGIQIPFQDAVNIPREMGRRFLYLWRKSQNEVLSEREAELWGSIVDQVDVAQYASNIAPDRYIEAKLLDDGHHPLIRLHDGQQKRVPVSEKEKLTLVDKGEWFGARVRFNQDGEISLINRVELIGNLPSAEVLSA
jgi:hypothetical protein